MNNKGFSMNLEDKIKAILGESKAAQDVVKNDEDNDEKDNTKSSVDDDTDDIEVKESVVPGTDALLGTRQPETLKQSPEEISGASKTAKMIAKYNKGTKQGTLQEPPASGSKDETAASETSKITAAYKTSAMPKLKEDAFEALFSGEQLSEEFKAKAEAIFEAAVEQVAEAKVQELQEEYQLQLEEAVEEVKGELVEQIDGYLDYVVEEWMQDNAVALESGIKVEMVSSFMENLKSVFEQHYIEVPESKIDVIEEQAKTIEKLQAELDEAQEAADRAIVESMVLKCEAIIAEAKEGLTAIEADKLQSLAENVEFDTEVEFARKVKALKESYFRKGSKLDEANITTQDSTTVITKKTHDDVIAVLKALHQGNKIVRSSN